MSKSSIRFGVALRLTCIVWLAIVLLSNGRYLGHYFWVQLPSPVLANFIFWLLAILFTLLLFFIFYNFIKFHKDIYTNGHFMCKFTNLFVISIFTYLLFISTYFGIKEMEYIEHLNQRLSVLHNSLQSGIAPPFLKLSVLPSRDELMGWMFLFPIIFTIIVFGLSIRRKFWRYLCTTLISMIMITIWFVYQDTLQHFAVYWYLLAGAIIGLGCASLIHIWLMCMSVQPESH